MDFFSGRDGDANAYVDSVPEPICVMLCEVSNVIVQVRVCREKPATQHNQARGEGVGRGAKVSHRTHKP